MCYSLGCRRLNGRCSFSNRRIIFRWQSWRSRFVNSRIVDFRVTDHSHEEWPLLGQCFFSLAIQNFGNLVGLFLLQQFSRKVRNNFPSNVFKRKCTFSKSIYEYVPSNANIIPMSSSDAFWATAQNRMTYFSLTDAGTMCSLPEPLIMLSSFSFSLSEPTKRKHTNPS